MRRIAALVLLTAITTFASGENLRGPLSAVLSVGPVSPSQVAQTELEGIVVVDLEGDTRFFDALDLEILIPEVVGRYQGAISVNILGTLSTDERAGILDVVGTQLHFEPVLRSGKLFFHIPIRADSPIEASAAVTVIDTVVPPEGFPIVLSLVPVMKGLNRDLLDASFEASVRPVSRDIGAISLDLITDEGTLYDGSGFLTPEFVLYLDGYPVALEPEYLLAPGLHRLALTSEKFQDQELTFGVERGLSSRVEVPLLLALATVNYTAPRGARVYVDGTALSTSSGDFTAPPGDHTIVVVVQDFTVTRRFSVEEGREYSLSILMDIAIEEIK